jgi:hypothetical protein
MYDSIQMIMNVGGAIGGGRQLPPIYEKTMKVKLVLIAYEGSIPSLHSKY